MQTHSRTRLKDNTRHEPVTLEGIEVLGLIERCQGQVRVAGLGHIIGLDYGAVLRLAERLGLNMAAVAALLVQWQNAELVGSNQYRLSLLLRGQAGTEAAMGAPIGSIFVVIDPSLVQSSLSPSERGLAFTWKWGPATKPIDDPTWQSVTASIAGIGLRPLSPVHLRARKNTASGDIHLSWIRRTRIGGDNWQPPDVPLGEETEFYEIDIHDGEKVKRTLSAASPQAVYTAAMQQQDFGAPVTTIDWSVTQMSAAFGRGQERRVSSLL